MCIYIYIYIYVYIYIYTYDMWARCMLLGLSEASIRQGRASQDTWHPMPMKAFSPNQERRLSKPYI